MMCQQQSIYRLYLRSVFISLPRAWFSSVEPWFFLKLFLELSNCMLNNCHIHPEVSMLSNMWFHGMSSTSIPSTNQDPRFPFSQSATIPLCICVHMISWEEGKHATSDNIVAAGEIPSTNLPVYNLLFSEMNLRD